MAEQQAVALRAVLVFLLGRVVLFLCPCSDVLIQRILFLRYFPSHPLTTKQRSRYKRDSSLCSLQLPRYFGCWREERKTTMTSSAALDKEPSSFSSLPHTLTQDSKNVPAVPSSEKHKKIWNVKKKKRQLPVISIPATKQAKKIRTAVTRTHSPRPVTPAITAPAWLSRVEKITPTIPGIENAAQHLFNTKARLPMTASPCDAHTFLALPTECTYEVCALLSWDKDEKITGEENSLREDQLDRRKYL